MAKRKGGKSKGYISKGSVGTTKTKHTEMSILRSMIACIFDKKGDKRTKASGKTYNRKDLPKLGNEHKAEQRREKKRAARIAKKTKDNEGV